MAVIGLVWLAALSRWIIPDTVVPWDSKNQFFAFFRFLATSLHDGTSIWWNPYHYSGHPSISDPQSLIFSPFLLWAWLDPAPTVRAFDIAVYVHLLIGGLAFAGLGARRDWPVPARVLAATVFMLGGSAAARMNHTGIIICYGLFPLALLEMEIALERNSVRHALGFTLIAALIVAARNQVALLMCLVLLVVAIREIANQHDARAALRARLPLIALVLVVGLVLTAVPILLTLQFAGLSNRPAVTLKEALEASLYPANLLNMLVPNVFGSLSPNFGYWGPNYVTIPDVAATDDTFNYVFFGSVPVVLLLWHGLGAGWLRTRGLRTWAGILAFAVLFSLGRYTPLFAAVFEHVPGFSYFRRPIDGTFIMGIAIAMLAGDLLARHVRDGLPRPSRLGALLVGGLVVCLVAAALHVGNLTGHAGASALQMALSLPLVAMAAAMLAGRWQGQQRSLALHALALLAAAELVVCNAGTRINAESRAYYTVLEKGGRDDTGVLDLLEREMAKRHKEGARPRIAILGMGGPWQNALMTRKLEAINGYNPLRIGIYDRYVEPGEHNAFADERAFPATFDNYDSPLARALGIEYLVLDRPIEKLSQLDHIPELETLMAGPDAWIYRLKRAMRRASFSSHVMVADADATTATGSLTHPPVPDRVLIDDETPPLARPAIRKAAPLPARVEILSWSSGRVELDVVAPNPGVVVLHDIFYPGWVAEVDGLRRPVLRADVMFRGVEVTNGHHRVVFSYQPLSLENLKEASTHILRPQPPGWRRTTETIIRLWQPLFPGD